VGVHFKRGDRHCGTLGIYVLCPLISVNVASSNVPNVLPTKTKASNECECDSPEKFVAEFMPKIRNNNYFHFF
jgi:hypothetical protein